MNRFSRYAGIGLAVAALSGALWAGQLTVTGASASSEQSGNYATNTIDGDQSTRWAAGDSTYPQRLTLDLGSSRKIDSAVIAFYNPTTRVYTYSLLKSSDGVKYDTVVRSAQSGSSNTTTNVINATARYLAVVFTGVTDISTGWMPWAALYEVTLYGNTVSVIGNPVAAAPGKVQELTIRSLDSRSLLIGAGGAPYNLGIFSVDGRCVAHVKGNTTTSVALPSVGVHSYFISGAVGGREVHRRVPLSR